MSTPPPDESKISSIEELVDALQKERHLDQQALRSFIGRNENSLNQLINGRTALSYAAEALDPICVRIILKYSHPSTIDRPDPTGRTALSYAATAEAKHSKSDPQGLLYDFFDINELLIINIKLLIAKNANPASRDQTGRTPLSWAAGMGCEETVKFFCNKYGHNDDVFVADHGGRSPLSYAAQTKDETLVRILLGTRKNYDDCDQENRTPLYWYIQERWKDEQSKNSSFEDYSSVQTFLPADFGQEPQDTTQPRPSDSDIIKVLNESVKGGMTLLSQAVIHDDEKAVQELMDMPNFTCDAINDDWGETALILALRHNKQSMSRLLWRNPGKSIEQINRHPSPDVSFRHFLGICSGWLMYSSMDYEDYKDLSGRWLFLQASLEELLKYEETKKVEQLLERLINTLQVPLNELNWVIGSKSSLRGALGNIKNIDLVHVLLEHGTDPATLCPTGKWFDLRPSEVKASLQLWQQPEGVWYGSFRRQLQRFIESPGSYLSRPKKDERLLIFGRQLQTFIESPGAYVPKPNKEQELLLLRDLLQKHQHTHGIKTRSYDEIEQIQCCENSKITILYQHPLINLLYHFWLTIGRAHHERDAWENFSDKKHPGSFESRTCHTTFNIHLQSVEVRPMCNDRGLKQTLWGVQWTLPHNDKCNVFYNSSLSKIWIPKSVTEFLEQFMEEFDREWERYCDSTEDHLVEHRQEFAKGSVDSKHISDLGRDLLYLAHLRRALYHQLKTIESEIKVYYHTVAGDDREDNNRSLQTRLKSIKEKYTDNLDRLEHTINSLSQLAYTRQSINEATFMRRISAVTFFYLPLMFTASLFGMNVNATKSFPGWQWFFPFAAGFLGFTYILWKLTKQPITGEESILELLRRIWSNEDTEKKKPRDVV